MHSLNSLLLCSLQMRSLKWYIKEIFLQCELNLFTTWQTSLLVGARVCRQFDCSTNVTNTQCAPGGVFSGSFQCVLIS